MSKASRRERQRLAKQQSKTHVEDELVAGDLPAVPPFPFPTYYIGDAAMVDKSTQTMDDTLTTPPYDDCAFQRDIQQLQEAKRKIDQLLAALQEHIIKEEMIQKEFQVWSELSPEEARIIAEHDWQEIEDAMLSLQSFSSMD